MSKRPKADPATSGDNGQPPDATPPPDAPTTDTPAGDPPELPVEQAIAAAIDALGPVAIDAESAPRNLAALAAAYDERERCKVIYERKKTAEKNAKAALEDATDHLIEMVKEVTHPKPLPLFDVAQAEADLNTMATAIAEARP
jgi:hypothetical protein